jgi:hypothetical protein
LKFTSKVVISVQGLKKTKEEAQHLQVHMDLFGPFKNNALWQKVHFRCDRYFPKICQLGAIPDKSASTVI